MLTHTDWQDMLTRLAALIAQSQKGYWTRQKENKCQKRDANEALEVSLCDATHFLRSPKEWLAAATLL